MQLPKKDQIQGKVQNPRKREIMEKRKKPGLLPPQPTPIHKVRMLPMIWSISIGQPGLAAWLCSLPAPAHPQDSATTKNISVINILLLLNPKHSSYWEEN